MSEIDAANNRPIVSTISDSDFPLEGMNLFHSTFETHDNNSTSVNVFHNTDDILRPVNSVVTPAHDEFINEYTEDYRNTYLDSSLSSSSESETNDDNLMCSLVDWALQNNITHSAVDGLLSILQPLHPSLPKDARTLLCTPRTIELKKFSDNGMYYHFGLSTAILKLYERNCLNEQDDTKVLSVQVNIDGVPLFKSNNHAFWPILGILQESSDKEPFVIGIYSEGHKPSDLNEYLHDFIQEMLVLENDGITIFGQTYTVCIHSFVCDAPARAYVKNVKSYSGYYGCDRCVQHGKWENKVTFPETDARLRSDIEFSEMSQEEHHLGVSPLAVLSIGMVSQFVLDYMHLVCLGVTRRLILTWTRGELRSRLPARLVLAISKRLVNLRRFTPREFARKPRSLAEIDRWKATELRQFLLYTGPLVLRGILPTQLYENFLLFSVALHCLCCSVA